MWTAEDRERYKEDGRRYPSDLTDEEWELVRSLFERYATLTKDLRVMVEGCLYLGGEGCRWRSLPKDFGPWQTVRGYCARFHRDGVWAAAAAVLTPAARARLGKSPAPSTGIVDSRSVTSGPQRGERGVDGNKKVKGIKRHLLTCSLGFVLAVLVSAARSFAPLPVRWRIEATFGTLTNRYRRLTRNLEQSPEAPEHVVEVANLRRVLRVLTRSA